MYPGAPGRSGTWGHSVSTQQLPHDTSLPGYPVTGKRSIVRDECLASLPELLLGFDIDAVGWPSWGEIDVMENAGFEPAKAHGTLHYVRVYQSR